jgi:transcriptional regulator with XRE-family HTH domain
MKSETVKKEFGNLFRIARGKANLSRRELALRIGVSRNTIMNWEFGKTFIEDFGLFDSIQEHTGIYVPALLDETVKNIRARKS